MSEVKFTKGEWVAYIKKPYLNQGFACVETERSRIYGASMYDSNESEVAANAYLIAAAPDMYGENEERAELIGAVYVALQQGDIESALGMIHERETIDFSGGKPVAVSPSLKRARGEL